MKKPASHSPAKLPPSRRAGKFSRVPKDSASEVSPFPIVGIGASAGGLEALVQFLEHTPADSGIGFVIVQHLDPTQKGMLPELLQRATTMKVAQVKDRTRVRPNCVYVIPPNRDLSLLHGVLHLLFPSAPRGLRLPIDFFFRSLAEDRHEHSIGILLSGMGSDGTLGMRAIKGKSGLTMVQDPGTAKFDSMPRSAVEAGLVDVVDSAEALPGRLIAYRQCLPLIREAKDPLEEKRGGDLEKIIILLRAHTRHDFSLYRRSTLYRRVERRMGVHQLLKVGGYVRYLQENPQELDILFKELLIGVTRFFRDPAAWRQLEKRVLRPLLVSRPAGRTLRAWVPGCSTGEEAYSLAMAFVEVQGRIKSAANFSLQIYATDLDKNAIDKARLGVYPENILADVSPGRISRFFLKNPGGYRVSKAIRSMVVFAPQNLTIDPPFTKLDLLCCRNLLIYFMPELQKKLFPLFHYSLNAGGALFLGSAESLGSFAHLFSTLANKERIFRRRETAGARLALDFPGGFVPRIETRPELRPAPGRGAPSLQSVVDQMLQTRYAPPAVIVNEQGDIIYINGRTGKYLEPASGKADWNVIAMAREGLRYDLASALQKVRRETGPVTIRGVRVGFDPAAPAADFTVQVLEEPKALRGMVLIVFSDSVVPSKTAQGGKGPGRTARQRELERELQHAHKAVQASREEMQSSQEELKSMNEELQSSNEEMQSTNEELMTSKEEMQSLNEELHTVNAELQTKLDELSDANNDMKNLLNSTDIATVFLDSELRLRRFTLQAQKIIKLIAGDVGRPITDLASDLLYSELVADAQEVLRTLVFSQRAVGTIDGRWFAVRVMPYRTTDNRIDGVVITFSDITAAKKTEAGLRVKNSDLTTDAAVQGRALGRAEERLEIQGARLQVSEAKNKTSRGAAAAKKKAKS
ncbi:MAG: PAS domain-containing protein [Undibacterium sp.]|nr:PAS domain-containing protein [Opitutaceae bacterium]